jgi:hypothetical protein
MPKKNAEPKATMVWAVYDKDDGRISWIAAPGEKKPTPSYDFQRVCRVTVMPVQRKK